MSITKNKKNLMEELKSMEEKTKEDDKIQESIEWLNDKEGTIIVTEKIPVKNEKGQIVGTKTEEYKAKTTIDEIKEGLNVVTERINKQTAQMEGVMTKLNQLGKVPFLTPEQVRLKENLRIIQANEQKRQFEAQIANFNGLIEQDKELIERRKKLLDSRPESAPETKKEPKQGE